MKKSDFFSLVAAIISTFALLTSIKSCQVSEEALKVSKLEFQGNRSLILRGEVEIDNESIKLAPQDFGFLLQQLHYRFPPSLGGEKKPSLPPDFKLYLAPEIYELKKELVKRFPTKKSSVSVGLEARIPFLIESYFTVKGSNGVDRSIYTLNFRFTVFDDPEKAPEVKLLGISFHERLQRDRDPKQELERAWNAVSK